jgi:hypothetical protein
MKKMIVRRNSWGRGIDVGWRFSADSDAPAYFWTTVRDAAALDALIANVRQLGDAFVPPAPAETAALVDLPPSFRVGRTETAQRDERV